MRELSILLKYLGFSIFQETGQTAQASSKRFGRRDGERKGTKNRATQYITILLLSSLPMAIFVFYSNYRVYVTLAKFPQVASIFFNTTISMFSLFYIVGFIGTGMYSFSRTDEIELLLTLPIKTSTLTIYSLLISLSSQLFTLSFFVGSALGYMFGVHVPAFSFILRTLLQLYFITSLSALFSVLGGGLSSKSIVRKLNVFMTLALVFVYFGFTYVEGINVEKLGNNANIARWLSFTNSKYNVLSWAYSDDVLLVVLAVILSILATALFWYMSGKVAFENTQRKYKKQNSDVMKKQSYASFLGGFLWKDLKLLVRNEQFIFLLLYPFIFGIFMMFVSPSSLSSIMPFIVIAVFYCAMEAGMLTSSEMQSKELFLTLPVTKSTMILPKVTVPVLINIVLFILVDVVALIMNKFDKVALIFIPISILLFALSAFIGAYYSITKPGKAKKQPFSNTATFIIEGITIGLAFAILFPITMLFETQNLKEWQVLTCWLVMIGSIIVSILLSYFYYRKLKKVIEME